MDNTKFKKVKKSNRSYRVRRPSQTGFSSPATHYSEPRIDLNDVLVSNVSSTFYVRIVDNTFESFGIAKNDVLIIDRSLSPSKNRLVLAIQEDSFKVVRMIESDIEMIQVWGVITYIIKSVL